MRARPIEPGTQRNPFCDFCTIALHGWEYPAANFDTVDPQTGRSWRSVGSWTACEFCRELVETGDVAELARRAFVGLSYYTRHSDSAKAANEMEANRAHYLALLQTAHTAFLAHRSGPPRRAQCLERIGVRSPQPPLLDSRSSGRSGPVPRSPCCVAYGALSSATTQASCRDGHQLA